MTPSHRDDWDWDVGGAKITDLDELGATGTPNVSAAGVRAPADDEYLTKPVYLDKAQAGNIVQLNPKTIERAILKGELTAFKLRGQIRIRRSDLEAWVEANRVHAVTELHDI